MDQTTGRDAGGARGRMARDSQFHWRTFDRMPERSTTGPGSTATARHGGGAPPAAPAVARTTAHPFGQPATDTTAWIDGWHPGTGDAGARPAGGRQQQRAVPAQAIRQPVTAPRTGRGAATAAPPIDSPSATAVSRLSHRCDRVPIRSPPGRHGLTSVPPDAGAGSPDYDSDRTPRTPGPGRRIPMPRIRPALTCALLATIGLLLSGIGPATGGQEQISCQGMISGYNARHGKDSLPASHPSRPGEAFGLSLGTAQDGEDLLDSPEPAGCPAH
jgi:hypothetical protein